MSSAVHELSNQLHYSNHLINLTSSVSQNHVLVHVHDNEILAILSNSFHLT